MRLSLKRTVPSVLAASGVATVALAVGATTGAAAAVPTASSLVASVTSAVSKQAAVHLVIVGKSKTAKSAERIVEDSAPKIGTETATNGAAHIAVRVTKNACFFTGNTSGLTTLVGMTAAQTKKVGSHWVSLTAKSSQCTSLKSSLSISSVKSLLPAAKGTTLSKRVVHGKTQYVLHWVTAASSTSPKLTSALIVSSVGAKLPISETVSASSGSETVTFSKWGEHLSVPTPPASATVAYTKIVG